MGNCIPGASDDEDDVGSESRADKSLMGNLMREQKGRDVFKYYEVMSVIGEGSMGAISSVRKKDSAVGGSAYGASDRGRNIFRVLQARKNPALVRKCSSSEFGREYALKTIQLNRITDEFIDELRNEIDILRSLDHPNIVKAYEVFERKRQIFIVMELCTGGDLYAGAPYSEKGSAKITNKILSAVAFMHQRNIVHRDLKFENIMFENKSEGAEIKIIDFGLSKKYAPGSFMTEGVGTIYTMAPQVLQGIYTSKADLWSVGVITYMLLSSSKPFYQRKRRYLIDKIMRCEYNFDGPRWKYVSEEAKDFVSALIKLNPEERLNAERALGHRWLSKEFPLSDRRPSEDFMDGVHDTMLGHRNDADFKKMALMVIAHKSSSEEIVKLRRAFDQFDSSNDGSITPSEFGEALSKFDYTDEEIDSLFKSVDVDRSGKIHYTEFLAATLEVHGHIEEDRLAEAFDRIDADDTGYISKKNLRDLLGTDYTPDRVDNMFEEADFDGDGRICFREFLKVVRQTNERILDEVAAADVSESESGGTDRSSSDLLTVSANIPGGKYDGKIMTRE